jgi:CoA:oxalate CoA-transferase
VAAGNDNLFAKLCTALGCEHLISDVRFATNAKRTEHVAEMENALNAVFKTSAMSHWIDVLNVAGVPCSPVNGMDAVLAHPQLQARNMFVEVDDPAFPGMKVPGNPIKMSALQESSRREKAPEIGEHNVEVLSSLLGLAAERVAELKGLGVL